MNMWKRFVNSVISSSRSSLLGLDFNSVLRSVKADIELVRIIICGEVAGILIKMDMFFLKLLNILTQILTAMFVNIVSLLKNILAGIWNEMRLFITLMELRVIIELRILNYLRHKRYI